MRDRSNSIYAKSEEEFTLIMDERNNLRSKRSSIVILEDDDLDEEFSCFQNYQMSEIQPTFTEREKIDETILLKSIENMNLNYKNYLMENEINNKDDNSCEYFGELPLKQNQHRNKDASITNLIYNSLSPLASNSTQSHTTTEELSLTNVDAIMSQNLVHFDAVAKLIVIGDKSVGKSLLIERFLSPEVNFDGKYIPTESLEIKKTILSFLHKTVKFELWDTNLNVLSSPLIETYYRISNGFILLCDYDRIESFNFCDKQLGRISQLSNYNNVFLIINKKKKNSNVSKEAIDSKIAYLVEKYGVTPHVIDCSLFHRNDSSFMKFIKDVLIKKHPTIFHRRSHIYCTNNQSDLITHLQGRHLRRSSSFYPKNQISDNDSSLNLNKKKNNQVKRNLSEALRKLSTSQS